MNRMLKWGVVCALAAFGCDDGDDSSGAGGEGGATADMGAGGEGGAGEGGMGGGEGGMGGGEEATCESECGRLADCSAASDACPGITADGRDAFYDGCLDSCAGNPALVALASSQAECEGLITTLSNVNADYAAACEGGAGGGGGEGGMGGEGGGEECEVGDDWYPGAGWDACVSDGGAWVLAGESAPSSIARVAAFEQMGDLLWNAGGPPGAEAFIDAQIIFVEDEGIGSRVARRYDSHIEPPEGANCREEETALPYPEYCVGPAQMLPIINDAFDAGAAGEGNPFVHTGRIEGALVWFLYVSTYKEANTCFGTAKDCDSAWAYFGAGDTVGDPAPGGFGKYVQEIDAGAYDAVFQGLLALRCWRDLDDGETAMNQALFEQARAQLDSALDYAYSLLLISRLEEYTAAESDFEKEARRANLDILGHSIDRAARARDAGAADRIDAAFEADELDAAAVIAELEILFPCP